MRESGSVTRCSSFYVFLSLIGEEHYVYVIKSDSAAMSTWEMDYTIHYSNSL